MTASAFFGLWVSFGLGVGFLVHMLGWAFGPRHFVSCFPSP